MNMIENKISISPANFKTGKAIGFYKGILIITILLSIGTDLYAHHGADYSGGIGATTDPFTGQKVNPGGNIQYGMDRTKNDRRQVYTNTFYIEQTFGDGLFSANFSLPWIHYSQRGGQDAGRWGKPYLGLRLMPYKMDLAPMFVIIDSKIGFPTGSDEKQFTREDYWDGIAGITVGYTSKWLSGGFRIGGRFPMSKLENSSDEYAGVNSLLRTTNTLSNIYNPAPPAEKLVKVTELSGFISAYLHDGVSLVIGYYARTPFEGIVYKEPGTTEAEMLLNFEPLQYVLWKQYDPVPVYPRYFEEASVGFSAGPYGDFTVFLNYRYPLLRDPHLRPYESAITFGVGMSLGSNHYNEDSGEKSENKETVNENNDKLSLVDNNSEVPNREK